MRLGRRFCVGAIADTQRVQVDGTARVFAEVPCLQLRRMVGRGTRAGECPGVEHVRVGLVVDVVAGAALEIRALYRYKSGAQLRVGVDGYAGVGGLAGGAVVGAIGDKERAVRQGEVAARQIGRIRGRTCNSIVLRQVGDFVALQTGIGFVEPVINGDVGSSIAGIGIHDALPQKLQRRVEVEFAGPGSCHALVRYRQRIGGEHRLCLIVLGGALGTHA